MKQIKTVGIAIDKWKMPIFKRHLNQADYGYTEHPGVSPNTLLLKVRTPGVEGLAVIVRAANEECAKGPKR